MSISTDNHGTVYFCPETAGLWKVNQNDMIPEQLHRTFFRRNALVYDGMHTIYFLNFESIKKLDLNENKESFVTRMPSGSIEERNHTWIGSYVARNINFTSMQRIAMDCNGNLYVTDYNQVRKITFNPVSIKNLPGYQIIQEPCGIAVDTEGTVYVADKKRHCIWEIRNSSELKILAGVPNSKGHRDSIIRGTALFDTPSEIAVDVDGTLLVLDNNGFRRVDKRKNIVWTETGLKTPHPPVAFTIDDQGVLFVQTRWNVIRFENIWKWERFLWIGKLKEQTDHCQLAKIPAEIIREISGWLITRFKPAGKPKIREYFPLEYQRDADGAFEF